MYRFTTFLLVISFCNSSGFGEDQDANEQRAIKTLIELTRDTNNEIRALAYEALSKTATDSAEVVMALSAGTSDPDDTVRITALRALIEISHDKATKASVLMTALGDANKEIAQWAGSEIVKGGSLAVPQLVEALKKDTTKMQALSLLMQLGAEAKDAAPALIKLAKDDDLTVRAMIINCLASIYNKGARFSDMDPRLQSMFESTMARYDTNSDGELDEGEIADMRTKPDGADLDGNGRLSRREYMSWFAKRYSQMRGSSLPPGVDPASFGRGRVGEP